MSEKYSRDTLYKLNPFCSLIMLKAHDTGKYIYNIISNRYDKDDESFEIYGNSENLEEAFIIALECLGYYEREYHKIYENVDILYNQMSMCGKEESKHVFNHVKIDNKFCEKEMGICKEQLAEEGARAWNVIYVSDGKMSLATR